MKLQLEIDNELALFLLSASNNKGRQVFLETAVIEYARELYKDNKLDIFFKNPKQAEILLLEHMETKMSNCKRIESYENNINQQYNNDRHAKQEQQAEKTKKTNVEQSLDNIDDISY